MFKLLDLYSILIGAAWPQPTGGSRLEIAHPIQVAEIHMESMIVIIKLISSIEINIHLWRHLQVETLVGKIFHDYRYIFSRQSSI